MPRANPVQRPQPSKPVVSSAPGTHERWYQAPLFWLGALIFFASLAGCILMVVLALRYADPPVTSHPVKVLGVPITLAAPSGPAVKP